ncbi:galactan 1,3-beta-galactosidase [Coprinellus micaceus]|uniref:Galactan 1,3-beta-galactosidase n=1 Tax=Coprinellus micaceus TaxID=71717 RepID=A0A4Y7TY44_COPMI|nr:galactan 1,3-beta-galactosidase [Coprinellus micaceus]
MFYKASLLAFASIASSSLSNAAVIVPGATWTDTSGNVIQAHGGGILKAGSTWYWHGEDKTHNSVPDLMTWTRQNDALTPISGTSISTSNIVERPKVIYNRNNAEYVMWFHSDSSNYGAAQVGVATAKSACGPFSYRGSFRPLNVESRDMGVYVDDDAAQTAYLLFASDNNQNFKIARMDSSYYNVTTLVSTIPRSTLESPGIVKRNGVYHLFASKTTGWDPNANKVITANSLAGPWGAENDIAPRATRTYFSQNTFNLPVSNNVAVYMGDRWRPQQLGGSRYIWYPMVWGNNNLPTIVPADVWRVDFGTGAHIVAAGTTYEAERGTLSGPARLLNNTGFSGGTAVGYIGNGGSVTINNVQGNGADQWISFYYANADSGWRNTTISVNGGSAVRVDQPNTGGGGVVLSVPVKIFLRSGVNSITVGAGQSNYAADLDKIVVYTDT